MSKLLKEKFQVLESISIYQLQQKMGNIEIQILKITEVKLLILLTLRDLNIIQKTTSGME